MPRKKEPTLRLEADIAVSSYACDFCDARIAIGAQHSIVIAVHHWAVNGNKWEFSHGQYPVQEYACCKDHALELAYAHVDTKLQTPVLQFTTDIDPGLPLHDPTDGVPLHEWWSIAASYNHRGDPSLPAQAYWELISGKQLWFANMDNAKIGFDYIADLFDENTVVVDPVDAALPVPVNRRLR